MAMAQSWRTRTWLVLAVVFIVVNLTALFYAWRRRAADRSIHHLAESRQERLERALSTAEAWISEWNSFEPLRLDSPKLDAAIAGMRADDCLALEAGAEPIPIANISPRQLDDLNLAIVGLLRAYATGSPEPVIEYMKDRGERFDRAMRGWIESKMKKKVAGDFAAFSDDELYAQFWRVLNCNSHWQGLVVESSCRQIWDGRKADSKAVGHFSLNDPDRESPPPSPASQIYRIMRGSSGIAHYFAPTEGSIADALGGDDAVLFADVKIIIVYDERFYHQRAPQLCRFWYNRSCEKWQPICLMAFSAHPDRTEAPTFMF